MMDGDKAETDDTGTSAASDPLLEMSQQPSPPETLNDGELSPAEKKMMSQFQSLNRLSNQNQTTDEEEMLEMTSGIELPINSRPETYESTENQLPECGPPPYEDSSRYEVSENDDSENTSPGTASDHTESRTHFTSVYKTQPGSFEAGPVRPQFADVVDDVASPECVELHDMGQQRYVAEDRDAEAPPQDGEEEEECECLGPLNFVGTYLLGLKKRLSPTKFLLLILVLIFLIGFIIFLGVFPNSFVFVEYYEIALKESKLTGSLNREDVVYPGCYVYSPDVKLIRFPTTAQTIDVQTDIFTLNNIIINIEFTLQYFLRPSEVGQLHRKFGLDYDRRIERVVVSTFKNTATQYDLDEFRLNRDQLEIHFHNVIRDRLNGNCCPDCCPLDCKNSTTCKNCDFRQTCHPTYHVDIRYFQLGKVGIPQAVFERFTKQTILQIEAEREFFIQEHAIEVKQTELESQKLLNEAKQMQANATAEANVIKVLVDADKEKLLTTTYVTALHRLYNRLNVTRQDQKLSLLMMRTFEDIKDNVYAYNYDKVTSMKP